jgi:hypothetical protein
MRKFALLTCTFLFVGFAWGHPNPAQSEEIPTKNEKVETRQILAFTSGTPSPNRITALRRSEADYSREDIELMVRIVFADAMNAEQWSTNWIRKKHIPSLTHLVILPKKQSAGPQDFTVLTLPEQANHRVVVVNGFQGYPIVRRWMSVQALLTYFRELTTSQGTVRQFEAGFMGLKGLRMGMGLKKMLDELHDQGLMRTKEEAPLSEEQSRENLNLRLTLSREVS